MTLEEAITTAIEFEKRVYRAYANAAKRVEDSEARRVFDLMAADEAHHVSYLESRLAEWQTSGHIHPAKLESQLPAKSKTDSSMRKLRTHMAEKPTGVPLVLGFLRQALAVENETSAFYRRMVAELPADGQAMFARFLEIEEGHTAIVQAELDNLSGTAFWFDVMEFDLEAG